MSIRFSRIFLLALVAMVMAALPVSAQDRPLSLPYDGTQPGLVNRAPFEVPAELLPLTRGPFSVTVTRFDDPVVGACDANDGMSLREALVNCSSLSQQPVVYLPSGTYTLNSTITVIERSFTVIGQSPFTTFIQGEPTNIRYFDVTLLGANTATFANLTVQNSTSGATGSAIRVAGNGSFRLDNMLFSYNVGALRGVVRFDVETGATLSAHITNSEFSANSATNGGAIAFTNELGGGTGVLDIYNTLFSNNQAATNAGHLLVTSVTGNATVVNITQSIFLSGTATAGSGGAIMLSGNGDSAVLNINMTNITGNTAAVSGGGIAFNNTAGNLTLSDTVILDNTFVTTGTGAGLGVDGARNVAISASFFENNDAKAGIAGAMYFGTNVGQVSLFDTFVSNNKAADVGGIYAFLVDSVTANRLIVTGNSALAEVGGALFAASNFVSLTNSAFTLNTAGLEVGGLLSARTTLLNVHIEDNSAPISPDCDFSALSGTSISLGEVSISNMTDCAGTFTPAPGDLLGNLVVNGGFEVAGAKPGKPAGWTLKGISGDKRDCNRLFKTITMYGDCAMNFKGRVGERATLVQNIDLTGLTFAAGEELHLYGMGKGSANKSKLKLTVTAFYSDQPKNKAIINFTGKQLTLTPQSQILTLTSSAVTKLTVQIQHTSPSGTLVLDRVYLTR